MLVAQRAQQGVEPFVEEAAVARARAGLGEDAAASASASSLPPDAASSPGGVQTPSPVRQPPSFGRDEAVVPWSEKDFDEEAAEEAERMRTQRGHNTPVAMRTEPLPHAPSQRPPSGRPRSARHAR